MPQLRISIKPKAENSIRLLDREIYESSILLQACVRALMKSIEFLFRVSLSPLLIVSFALAIVIVVAERRRRRRRGRSVFSLVVDVYSGTGLFLCEIISTMDICRSIPGRSSKTESLIGMLDMFLCLLDISHTTHSWRPIPRPSLYSSLLPHLLIAFSLRTSPVYYQP